MTDDELEAAGLYQCASCLSLWESEKALLWCCDSRYDQPSFRRNYELGNN